MTLKIIGLQSGPFQDKESRKNRIERLGAQFDKALEDYPEADLFVFPELMSSPYFCTIQEKTLFDYAEPLEGETVSYFVKKSKEAKVTIIVPIAEKARENTYYNTAVVISDGEVLGTYRKTHIPTLQLASLATDEQYYFDRGTEFPVFQVKGYKIGILICFDRSFPEAARTLANQGADVIIIPTASAGHERKGAWLAECAARARENGVYVLGVNRAGEEILSRENHQSTSTFFGMSCFFGPSGEELIAMDDQPWKSVGGEVSKMTIKECRQKVNFLSYYKPEIYSPVSKETSIVRTFHVRNETQPLFQPKGAIQHA
ncbi:carbon-nitrogen hydrolase family protein [Metabacillus halosaccharovorans]|uniref:carbon-nitrogen hydrolase family protein n=1 Tax=Metabacillus halosaccharovorans TaxID=930124 RepID=UPI00203CC473|nr:carbon-nitrogen hydrolase family protein [Metabacillus halosaccharovorans]MCM3443129.1 carbon-nitrogen hydrolase family protein [Metabacillus halosaccharovorans]